MNLNSSFSQTASNPKRQSPGFAKPVPGSKNTWNGWAENAEYERSVMLADFHKWVTETRHATEKALYLRERNLLESAPFAKAGIDAAETPADVPLSVIEFAMYSLEAMEHRRKLDILNSYYGEAALDVNESYLDTNRGKEGAVEQLWQWFLKERNGDKEDAE